MSSFQDELGIDLAELKSLQQTASQHKIARNIDPSGMFDVEQNVIDLPIRHPTWVCLGKALLEAWADEFKV